jgi:DNA repair exonuclease SbcCD ATPase subunit
MSEEREEYKFDHFKNIDEVMHYFNYWYKEEDVYSINRYLSLKDFNYISNKYQELQKENQELKKQLHDASIQIQELIEKDIWCPSNCEKLEKLQQENKQLKDNWNELKEWASNFYNSEEVGWAGCGMRYTLEKIQELEQGSDNK